MFDVLGPREGAVILWTRLCRVLYQKAALYVSRIVAGTPAGALPVELPTRAVLLVNLKSAKVINRELRSPS